MLNEIESLKAQLRSKVSCVTSDSVKPKVLAPGMYAIDVKPIPHPLKNNRSAHLNYITMLKESVEQSTGKKVALGKLNCGYQWNPRKKFCLRRTMPLTKPYPVDQDQPLVSGLRCIKTYDGKRFKAQELCGKVHRDSQIRE
ncbi:hypothetical protein Tco_1030860 [Tanacetum coccineum]|uniref:Uncharacterized protein n=1 Tax=Tanacetum coccineum TaxID=301880 RepID=A0ABQ5G7J3_9ASTR